MTTRAEELAKVLAVAIAPHVACKGEINKLKKLIAETKGPQQTEESTYKVERFVILENRVGRKEEGKKDCNRVYAMGENKQHRKWVENWRDTKNIFSLQ